MIKALKKYITEDFLKKRGYQLRPFPEYSHEAIMRAKAMQHYDIDVLFDIGANSGQYGSLVRTLGFKGKIVSFEPLDNAFNNLEKKSNNDLNWIVNNFALGDTFGKSFINVSGNSYSSSILNMLERHSDAAPASLYVSKQEIEVKTLDSIYKDYCNDSNNIMLKVDTQGYERNVLDGADEFIKQVTLIELEMSLVPLYENQLLFRDLLDYVEAKGFKLFSLENEFSDEKNGQLLQVDGIFINNNKL